MFALRITGDTDFAHDAVQEAMAALWQKLESGDVVDNPKAYLYKVCRTKALDMIPEAFQDIDSIVEITDEEIDTSERDAKLWKAIGELPNKMRNVFLMSKRDGLKYREIAEELGISVKTVENQIAGALARLRKELADRAGTVFFLPFL